MVPWCVVKRTLRKIRRKQLCGMWLMGKGDSNWVLSHKINNVDVNRSEEADTGEKTERRQWSSLAETRRAPYRPADGGHCGTVRSRRDAGATEGWVWFCWVCVPALAQGWGVVIAPADGWRVKKQAGGGGGENVCTGARTTVLCLFVFTKKPRTWSKTQEKVKGNYCRFNE